jgi:hypothetical protein
MEKSSALGLQSVTTEPDRVWVKLYVAPEVGTTDLGITAGIVTLDSPEHEPNASEPMDTRLSGITRLWAPVQLKKLFGPTD